MIALADQMLPGSAPDPGRAETNAERDATLQALLARLADGDRSAFTAAFKLLWPPTLGFCSSLLKSEADACDAAQLALEKVFVRCGDYDRSRPPLPWVLAIAAWECKTLLRKRVRRREAAEHTVPESLLAAPEDHVVRRDLVRAALTALGELSPTDRDALLATFYDEAPAARGATLRKRRERAIQRLRTAFRRLYGLG